MVRTLAIVMLLTPAAAQAQVPRDLLLGESLSGTLGPDDRTQFGRAFDDYLYSAVPGTQARALVRSSTMALDVNIYFFDDYFDLLPFVTGGPEPDDAVEFTVPDSGSPTLVVIRVTTVAGDSGPSTGDYSIELSER